VATPTTSLAPSRGWCEPTDALEGDRGRVLPPGRRCRFDGTGLTLAGPGSCESDLGHRAEGCQVVVGAHDLDIDAIGWRRRREIAGGEHHQRMMHDAHAVGLGGRADVGSELLDPLERFGLVEGALVFTHFAHGLDREPVSTRRGSRVVPPAMAFVQEQRERADRLGSRTRPRRGVEVGVDALKQVAVGGHVGAQTTARSHRSSRASALAVLVTGLGRRSRSCLPHTEWGYS